MTRTLLIALLFALAGRAAAAEAGVEKSTATAKPRTIDDIYYGGKMRDPFLPLGGGGAPSVSGKEFDMADFSIHELELKGIMRDKDGAFALLVDLPTRTGFILRRGRVYTYKNERVPGVTGRINLAQKTVVLMTIDKDVQTLRLGEKEEDADDGDASGEES